MKGISPFISTAFVALFGVVLITVVMLTLGSVQTEGIDKTVNDQLTITTRELGTEIIGVYDSVKDYDKDLSNNTVALIREVDLNLPKTIGSRNYKIEVEEPQDVLLSVVELVIDGVVINSTSKRPTARVVANSKDVSIENKLYNIDIGLQGFTKGGDTKIRGYSYNYNGTTRDKIILGDDSIIIGIEDFNVTDVSVSECSTQKKVIIEGHSIYTSGEVPSIVKIKSVILETNEENQTESSNPFEISVCISIDDKEEGTALIELWDLNDNRGAIRKKFIG